ncbi:putative DNA polymerase alpha epsilon subunit B [Trypanosoma vivax]|uniref:DNA polymerase alpha subunit B n=1 Tax=Trypanosoma vivax (strain Y486) TaxID=1055687 RepID=G0U900_TRYVY|nr:putative DNA polymerase alpha epsilon subunit B [Trypanosoma vivax]CCC54082.1 conserved hypothetical protein [Trypanosoma vivax Y486]
MQQPVRWRAAANLDLLLGAEHPPARITRDRTVVLTTPEGVAVDARNTVKFKDTLYCNRQDYKHSGTRHRLAEYYRHMFSKIFLWEPMHDVGEGKKEESDSQVAKQELPDDATPAAPVGEETLYRAVGIITQMCSPGAMEDELLLPWEFFPISNVDDDEAYAVPLCALTRQTTQMSGLLRIDAENEEERGDGARAGAVAIGDVPAVHDESSGYPDALRLSLYTRLVQAFTGLYPGMAVGVVGEPFKRSSSGVLTALLVRRFVLPIQPSFPWDIHRPLPQPANASPVPTRVHFCSGPFPRREIHQLLRSVTLCALQRGADLLVIGGPLVKEFEDFERDFMTTLQRTFDELLSSYVDTIEETMENYYATQENLLVRRHLKVVLVSHREDVTQIPAIPSTMYGLESADDVWVRSNPCRISVHGIHFGVCNEDVVSDMRERMVERWPTESGSLRRVVEALVRSRLYATVYELPAVKHDLRHLHVLRMDFVPQHDDDSHEIDLKDDSAAWASWNAVRLSSDASRRLEYVPDDSLKRETKRIKHEKNDAEEQWPYTFDSNLCKPAVEWMPHVMFLPSTRPRFAVVTHQHNETNLDDVANASGVLVINQEVWSRRAGPRFQLRVVEVTVLDSERVVHHGASEATGVSCGVIHFIDSTATQQS